MHQQLDALAPLDRRSHLAAMAAEIERQRKALLDQVEAFREPAGDLPQQEIMLRQAGRRAVAMEPREPPVENVH